MNEFEKKLLNRVSSARRRVEKIESVEELRPDLTMRRVKTHLEPRVVTSEEIQEIRNRFRMSQSVFAAFVQVPVRTLQEWEQGRAEVPGVVSKFFAEMMADPEYWERRINEAFDCATS